ncbi:Hypothetical protein CINCED_3A017760 [Cinara cedri]|nr:Hypothetical protein CINCED_3A017760 [Cinara cedri]
MGYGEESGVINLLVAASCILEVLTNMTDGFLECLSVFNVSSTYVKIILFAEELFIELGIGIIFGVIMMFVPSNAWTKLSSILKKRKNDNPHINKNQNIVSLLSIIRAILLCFVGLLIGLYKWYTDLPITYSLGCAISTILASTSWKCKNQNNINPTISSSKGINNQAQHEINAISKIFEFIWNVLHPLIFVLIGYDLSYTIYSINTAMVLTGIIIFMVVIIIRIITATCSVWGTGFNYNEIIFINMAWIVNSSIMTCFTTTSHLFGQTPLEDFYNQIVLIIGIFLLLRVFLGSFVIHKFGPILLTNTVQYGH